MHTEYDYDALTDELIITTITPGGDGVTPLETVRFQPLAECDRVTLADALRDVCPDTLEFLSFEEDDADEWRISFRAVYMPLYQALELHARARVPKERQS